MKDNQIQPAELAFDDPEQVSGDAVASADCLLRKRIHAFDYIRNGWIGGCANGVWYDEQ